MRLRYQLPLFEFKIGSFDATNFLDSITVSAPISEPSAPLLWTGNFQVSYNRKVGSGLTENDFDQFTVPQRWRPDQVPVSLKIKGFTLPIFRIASYAYNRQTNTGQGTLHQVLAIADIDRPATEPDIEAGAATPISDVVNLLIDSAFAGSTLSLTRAILPLTGNIDSKVSSRNPIGDAQKLVSTNWQWLSVDNQERVITVSGDPADNPLLFARSYQQVEWEPDLSAISFAREKVIVTGSRQVPDDSQGGVKFILIVPNDNIDRYGREKRISTETMASLGSLYPRLYPNDATQVVSEQKIIYRGFTSDYQGHVVVDDIPDAFPVPIPMIVQEYLDTAWDLQINEIAPAIDSPDQRQSLTVQLRPGSVIFSGPVDPRLFIAELTVETRVGKWTFKPIRSVRPKATVTGDARFSLVLASEELQKSPVVPSPAVHTGAIDPKTGKVAQLEKTPVKEARQIAPTTPLKTEVLKGECSVQPAGWTPIINRPLVQDWGFIPSQAHADNLACQIARREMRRRDTVQVKMPIPDEWMAAGFPLMARCHVGDRELQIDGPIISISDGGCEFSFAGGTIGILPSAVADPPLPAPYIPSGSLQLIPAASPIIGSVGVPTTPIPLTIGGGP
jgi:hypothetical protein